MRLPRDYTTMTPKQRRLVRETYIALQYESEKLLREIPEALKDE